MAIASQDAIAQLAALMDRVDEPLKTTFKNMHQGYPTATLVRFLKAREWSVPKAHKMLVDCLNWRIKKCVDEMLKKPIIPTELYRGIRESQLVGLTGYTKEGLPVFALGVGLSTFDKASVDYYVQSHIQINEYRDRVILPAATKKYGRYIGKCVKILDMSGLRLSALSHTKLLTVISTIDDLNYPEKTQTYYVVNAPYVFSACWKVVKPLLHERTRRKVEVLQGCGRDELLRIMDHDSLPFFCRRRSTSSSRVSSGGAEDDCYSLDHPFHQQLYNYVNQQAGKKRRASLPKQGSSRVGSDHEGTKIVRTTVQSELHKVSDCSQLARSLSDIYIEIA